MKTLEDLEASALLTPKNGQAVNKSRHFDDILHDFLKQVLKSKSERSFVLFSTHLNLCAKIFYVIFHIFQFCAKIQILSVPTSNHRQKPNFSYSLSEFSRQNWKTPLVAHSAFKKSDIWG